MSVKNILVRFLIIFACCVAVFKFIDFAADKKLAKYISEEMPATSQNDIKSEPAKQQSDDIAAENTTDHKEAAEDDSDNRAEIESRIKEYLDDGKTEKAKKLYEDNKGLKLSESLYEDIVAREKELVSNALNDAKEAYLDGNDLSGAKKILENCRKNTGDNEKLSDCIELLNSVKPVSLTSVKEIAGSDITRSSRTDSFGNSRSDVLYLTSDFYGAKCYGLYYIGDMNVDSFTATLVADSYFDANQELKVKVTVLDADMQTIDTYTSETIKRTTVPFEYTVNFDEASFIQLELTDIKLSYLEGTILDNPVLYKQLTEDDFDDL